jgi:hypothetical protein
MGMRKELLMSLCALVSTAQSLCMENKSVDSKLVWDRMITEGRLLCMPRRAYRIGFDRPGGIGKPTILVHRLKMVVADLKNPDQKYIDGAFFHKRMQEKEWQRNFTEKQKQKEEYKAAKRYQNKVHNTFRKYRISKINKHAMKF